MTKEQPTSGEGSFEEMAKQDTFDELRKKIDELVEKEQYGDAEGEIKKELSALSGMFGGDPSERLRKLRVEFEATLGPETRELINPEGPQLRGRIAAQHAERLGREIERSKKEAAWIESGSKEPEENIAENLQRSKEEATDEAAESKFVKERSWDIPTMDEIRPGLVLSVSSLQGKTPADRERKPGVRGWHMEYYEVKTRPIVDGDKDLFVEVIDMSTGEIVDKTLAEFGILPYKANGMWDAEHHIVGWIHKNGEGETKKNKGKGEKKEE
ncbi:MAG: hypothetical protein WCF77_02815 [Minisyncoccia bacterium]